MVTALPQGTLIVDLGDRSCACDRVAVKAMATRRVASSPRKVTVHVIRSHHGIHRDEKSTENVRERRCKRSEYQQSGGYCFFVKDIKEGEKVPAFAKILCY